MSDLAASSRSSSPVAVTNFYATLRPKKGLGAWEGAVVRRDSESPTRLSKLREAGIDRLSSAAKALTSRVGANLIRTGSDGCGKPPVYLRRLPTGNQHRSIPPQERIRNVPFGKREGGGRRSTKRIATPLPALLITMSHRHPAILLDMSQTGARLRAQDAPPRGAEVFLRVGSLDLYARVIWTRKENCGIRFDQPLHAYDLHQLSIESGKGGRAGMTAAQKGGADDWGTGVAR